MRQTIEMNQGRDGLNRTMVGLVCLLVGSVWPCLASAAQDTAGASPPTERPNVIVILVDDLGWMDLSCQGSDYYRTPNIDRLARNGVRFTQGYAACAVCSPTRAAIQTGRYPARIGVTDWIRARFQRGGVGTPDKNPVDYVGGPKRKLLVPPNPFWMERSELTLAEVLKQADYRTAYIGKWHLGDEAWYPEHQGFDVNLGGCDYGQPPSYFDPFQQPKHRHPMIRSGIPGLPGRKPGEYLTDREADEAVQLIRQWSDGPFFIQLAHYAVHTPIQAPSEVADKYLQPGKSPIHAKYAAMVESVDRCVGKLLTTLDELNLSQQTLILFTSDNGGLDNGGKPTDNAPLRSGKGYAYEGGLRVPFLMWWPGQLPQGFVSQEPVCSIDVFPTLLEACGIDLPKPPVIDGVSLWKHARDANHPPLPSRDLYWHFPHYRHPPGPYSVIRSGRFKLIKWYEGRRELYDLQDDLSESRDLSKTQPERVQELERKLDEALASMQARIPRPNPAYQGSAN